MTLGLQLAFDTAARKAARRAACVVLALAVAAATAARSAAQSRWAPVLSSIAQDVALEHRPYRIAVLLAFENQAIFTPRLRQGLAESTGVLIRRTVGDPWQCEVSAVGPELDHLIETRAVEADEKSLEAYVRHRDKLFLVQIGSGAGRYALAAREYDVATRQWGAVRRRSCAVRGLLDRAVLELCLAIFSPLAEQAPGSEAGRVALTVQGAALPTADATVQLVAPGTVFGLFRVFGNGETTQVQAVDWTYLVTERTEGSTLQCRLLSAYRSPTTRRAPASRLVALGMRPVEAPTRLRFLGRDGRPLAGYEAQVSDARPGAVPRLLATDPQGRLTVPADDALVSVALRNGSQTLVRLWVLSGAIPDEKEVVVPDDPVRFEVESRLAGLQDAMIDEVARRTLTIRRVQALMDRNQWEQAKRLLDALRASRAPLQSRLDKTRAEALRAAKDRGGHSLSPSVQEMIDQTQKYLEVLLDPKHVDDLRAEYESRSRAAQADRSE